MAGSCAAVDSSTLWWDVPPTSTVYQAGLDAGLGGACEKKRYALFFIDVNVSSTNGAYVGFELKASTNNFSALLGKAAQMQFYSQSEVADTGGGYDKMKLFVCTSHGSEDVRSYTRITNTIDFPHYLTRVVVLVDASCLVRCPDGDWLRDDNEDLMWSYTRDRVNDPSERESGTDRSLWRPTAPVRWYKKLPSWAR